MKTVCFLLVVIVTAVSARYFSVFSKLEKQAYNEVKALYKLLSQAEIVDVTHIASHPHSKKTPGVTLGTFSYSNCADPKTEIVVPSNLSISPDPIKIPGIIIGSGTVQVKSPFGSPVKAVLEVWKSVFGVWVKAPCVDNFGSCTYDDFCTIVNPTTCPPQFVQIGLNCKCPFTAGNWNVPPVAVNVTSSLPFPISGGVKAQITATYNGNLVTCLEVQFDLA